MQYVIQMLSIFKKKNKILSLTLLTISLFLILDSLEYRIEHYAKKRRIEILNQNDSPVAKQSIIQNENRIDEEDE